MRPPPFRTNVRRVVIIVPSLFTLFNLFFGIWSMVLASKGTPADFYRASWFIVFAGVLDSLDGRLARLSNTGTRFGAELDSLVDVVSFGVAPAFLMYELAFASMGAGAWVFCYFYVMGAAIRLARFNLTQAGRAKTAFVGLPSPAAGMTLATYFPFTTTALYQARLAHLPWPLLLSLLMILLTILMVSNVRYAAVPRAGFRTVRGVLGLLFILSILFFGIWQHDEFFFPLGVAYMAYGVLRAALLGLFATPDEDEEAEIAGPIVLGDSDRRADAYGEPRRGHFSQGGGEGGGSR
ncbi:MAG: CDP-diacylglycerol--serine O-phosphatidyltransferase [Gemmatimonadetes bacterium 13_1_40CM_4_69_8]|nr:MAG: CDP-diacylglycerol--serine O-phosphatidyltransferase [Gemmatimonadetes bacterium 13_1_40CM_70_15]OLC72846.1 MAG: CDP-diacylglycerol--serine O-phosphatidyltransferase [Gemmatimonadetes bacterium 13_1_40CM_4_69_8]PYP72422.1 MAG: CDP-diacylglycerol--serine O-phosphatidyltransferase [Gemmatimonadota bacterium]